MQGESEGDILPEDYICNVGVLQRYAVCMSQRWRVTVDLACTCTCTTNKYCVQSTNDQQTIMLDWETGTSETRVVSGTRTARTILIQAVQARTGPYGYKY